MKRLIVLTVVMTMAAGIASASMTLVGDPNARVTTANGRQVFTFTQTGTISVKGSGNIELLMVGGGGAGGGNNYQPGGGGGGGAVYYSAAFPVTEGEYVVTVGTGGVGCILKTATDGYVGRIGNPGSATSAFGVTVAGGGGGFGGNISNGGRDDLAKGGCGGGATHQNDSSGAIKGGTSVYADETDERFHGFAGGSSTAYTVPAGGGGAGGVGGSDGVGGLGFMCAISGKDVYYGAGGAGGAYTGDPSCPESAGRGQNGLPGTGAGGGGGYVTTLEGTFGPGTVGGDGVVIIRVKYADAADTEDFLVEGGDRRYHDGDYAARAFLKDGLLRVTGAGSVDLLIVGGGGAGGGHNYQPGGGGGGGAVYYVQNLPVTEGEYVVTVGTGGVGCILKTATDGYVGRIGNPGSASSAFGVTVAGGGGGFGGNISNGGRDDLAKGGCGGGATHQNDSSGAIKGGVSVYADETDERFHGFAGGSSTAYTVPAGGGGAGGVGGSDGVGGLGFMCAITGRDVYYGAGGAGGAYTGDPSCPESAGRGQNGLSGTGAGGGGGYVTTLEGTFGPGTVGGDGVVIVRYRRKPSGMVLIFR